MSRFLLDTHTFIWAAQDSSKLSRTATVLIADKTHEFFVSAVTAWEIATKARIGKLDRFIADTFDRRMQIGDYIELPISIHHGSTAGAFADAHKDPFDRILAAQALLENLTLLSNDTKLDAFGIHRVW